MQQPERFVNDRATTSTNIWNFFLQNLKKTNKKTKNILAFQWQKRALTLFVPYWLYTSLSHLPDIVSQVFHSSLSKLYI